jgi:hypothetical protein
MWQEMEVRFQMFLIYKVFFSAEALSIHNSSSVWSERKAKRHWPIRPDKRAIVTVVTCIANTFVRTIMRRDTYTLWPTTKATFTASHSSYILAMVSDSESAQIRGRTGYIRIHRPSCRTKDLLRTVQSTQWDIMRFRKIKKPTLKALGLISSLHHGKPAINKRCDCVTLRHKRLGKSTVILSSNSNLCPTFAYYFESSLCCTV